MQTEICHLVSSIFFLKSGLLVVHRKECDFPSQFYHSIIDFIIFFGDYIYLVWN